MRSPAARGVVALAFLVAAMAAPGTAQSRPDSAKVTTAGADTGAGGMAGMNHGAMSGMPGMGTPSAGASMAGMVMRAATAAEAAGGAAVHATPPKDMMLRWKVIRLPGMENPLRQTGVLEERVRAGRRVYFQNCVLCHGPQLDGEGQFAKAFTKPPRPLNDLTFLPMHPESYVFWRIAKGASALPGLMEPWNSAMPAFEDFLTDEQIWAVVLFLYERNGFSPGQWMWTEEQMKRGGAHVHVLQD